MEYDALRVEWKAMHQADRHMADGREATPVEVDAFVKGYDKGKGKGKEEAKGRRTRQVEYAVFLFQQGEGSCPNELLQVHDLAGREEASWTRAKRERHRGGWLDLLDPSPLPAFSQGNPVFQPRQRSSTINVSETAADSTRRSDAAAWHEASE